MNTIKAHLIKLLSCLSFIYFVKSLSLNKDNNHNNVQVAGIDTNLLPTNSQWSKEQKVLLMEEKLNSLSESLNELEENIIFLINNNTYLLQKNLQTTMDEIIAKKLKLNGESGLSNNVQELKCSDDRLPESCYDLKECNNNVYSIMIPEFSSEPFRAVCDLKTLNGGWTIIQRRQNGFENFYRNWTEYVEGFGDVNGEFFIGLKKLYALTSLAEPQELYIILEDFEGDSKYARYKQFKVDSESTDYRLTIGQYIGNAGDSLSQHSGQKFSTKDRDNDKSIYNCAERWRGAWWYDDCYYSNLNGRYLLGKNSKAKSKQGVAWGGFRGHEYSLKFVQMMIRPKEN